MNLPDWTFWPLFVLAAVLLVALGYFFIKFTLRLPELVRAFVAVICGGLLVIFASFRIMVTLLVPNAAVDGELPVGFDMVPMVMQASLLSGVLVVSYLGGVLWAERRFTRNSKKKPLLSAANG